MTPNPYEQLKMQSAPAPAFGNRRSFNRSAMPTPHHDGVADFLGGMFDTGAELANYSAVHGMADTGPAPAQSVPTPPMQPAYNLRQRMGQFGLTQQFDFHPA